MGNRQYYNDSKTTSPGTVYMDVSFMTAGTSQPTVTYLSALGASPATAGTTMRGNGVKSITRTGAGVFTVVLQDNYRYAITKFADLEDNAGTGAYASIGSETNASSVNPLTFTVRTWTAGGVATDFGPGGTGAALRVSLSFALKNTLEGT